jgi:hypothetical protein
MGIITDILKDIPISAVLRERLLLQESIHEKRMTDLKTKVTVLEPENTNLKVQLAESQKVNEELRGKIKQYEQVAKQLPKGPRTKRGDFM